MVMHFLLTETAKPNQYTLSGPVTNKIADEAFVQAMSNPNVLWVKIYTQDQLKGLEAKLENLSQEEISDYESSISGIDCAALLDLLRNTKVLESLSQEEVSDYESSIRDIDYATILLDFLLWNDTMNQSDKEKAEKDEKKWRENGATETELAAQKRLHDAYGKKLPQAEIKEILKDYKAAVRSYHDRLYGPHPNS